MKIFLMALMLVGAAWSADLTGTYVGDIKIVSADGEKDSSAVIIIKSTAGELAITAGPRADEQLPAANIKADDNKLTFEVSPPSGPGLISFAVQVDNGRLTGSLTMKRGDETRTAKLDLKKE